MAKHRPVTKRVALATAGVGALVLAFVAGGRWGGGDDSSPTDVAGVDSSAASPSTSSAEAETLDVTTTTIATTSTVVADSTVTSADQPETAPVPPVEATKLVFSEDFLGDDSMSRFEIGLYHRDDSIIGRTSWLADHAVTGPNDLCGPPTEKRTVERGERTSGFNDDWAYRCVPGGDLAKAHMMTSIGDTSGYSIGAFTPAQEFSDVREVRWDVNQTDLGKRQWTEVVLVPVDSFDMQSLPCLEQFPCSTVTHDQTDSVGTHWGALKARAIVTPEQPNGYAEASGSLGYKCDGCPFSPGKRFGSSYGVGDPALTSVAIRRQNYFRDNGDGTLTWGYELDDGSFDELTVPGEFPDGSVRIVFKDHSYTPLKDPATMLPETTFTWHWDNIEVHTEAASS